VHPNTGVAYGVIDARSPDAKASASQRN
jgi:hypothetical protein